MNKDLLIRNDLTDLHNTKIINKYDKVQNFDI